MFKLGFLASGNGSSAQAIMRACAVGDLPATPALMVSNRRESPALAFAAGQGGPALCIPPQADPDAADRRLADALADHGVDLVVMSGYLRRLGPATLARFAGRVI